MRVDVVDRRFDVVERHPHAAHRAFAGRRDHVEAVGGGAIADDFAIDARAARLGMLELFQHQDARAAGDDEAVAVLVVGARGMLRRLVEIRGHGAHGVEQTDSVQSSSSQPPAKMMSCLPSWISSQALPMQWLEVAQAEEIE